MTVPEPEWEHLGSMVERVARAICVAERMNPDDKLGGWLHWQTAARAALVEMRICTSSMADAGFGIPDVFKYRHHKYSYVDHGDGDKWVDPDDARALWRDMIDVALAEPFQPVPEPQKDAG